jgi:hypothetical protein
VLKVYYYDVSVYNTVVQTVQYIYSLVHDKYVALLFARQARGLALVR